MAFKSSNEGKENFLESLVNDIKESEGLSKKDEEIKEEPLVDIITFCNSETLMDLPGQNFNLFLSQRVILKTFYMGTRGNENITLTDEEWNWLYTKQQTPAIVRLKRKTDGCEDGKTNFNFSELNLACGRRASKTILASVICAYEAYKLIKLGDPYKFYGIPSGHEIAILNVANSQKQAGRLFAEIKSRIRDAPFFKNRVQGKGGTNSEIRLFTDIDLEKMKTGNYNIAVDGSIVLVCGHSNPDTLRGYSAICIIFDELQYYDEHPIISGKDFYNALVASVAEFGDYGDARIVEISTTGSPHGIFYNIHQQGQSTLPEFNQILGYHLATWDINEKLGYNSDFLTLHRKKDQEAFDIEYGARWAISGYIGRFFAEEKVKMAVKPFTIMQERNSPGVQYFMHVDPAGSHDNYSVVIVYRKPYTNFRGEKRVKICLAFSQYWKPDPSTGLNMIELDDKILDISRKFKPSIITYDNWNSVHSIDYLRRKGFNATKLNFGRGAKSSYYKNLYDLMDRDELELYGDDLLIAELLNIKYRPTARGISLYADPHSDVGTDDLVDGLAGACWSAIGQRLKEGYPTPVCVKLNFM